MHSQKWNDIPATEWKSQWQQIVTDIRYMTFS